MINTTNNNNNEMTTAQQLAANSDSGTTDSQTTLNTSDNNNNNLDRSLSALHLETVNQLDLYIENVQAGGLTSGDFACLASNNEGTTKAHTQIVIAVQAKIINAPQNQTKLEGDKLELGCIAKAIPSNITYKWLFQDKPIQSLRQFEGRFSQRKDGSLVIHSLKREDEGQYKCQASNGLMQRLSLDSKNSSSALIYAEASAQVLVEYPARVSHSPPIQYLPLGLSGLIRCHVDASPKPIFHTWTFNGKPFDPNRDPNLVPLANGSLLIRSVTRDYIGTYLCSPMNKHGSAGSSAPMEVRVEEPPSFLVKPAEFYKASLNGIVKMACEATGSPRPTVEWRKVIQIAHQRNNPNMRHHKQQRSSTLASSEINIMLASSVMNDEASDDNEDIASQMHLYPKPQIINQQQDSIESTTSTISNESPSDSDILINNNNNNNDNQGSSASINNSADIHFDSGRSLVSSSSSNLHSKNNHHQFEVDEEEQSSVINLYAAMPSNRTEFKNNQLIFRELTKKDHGRYECVIENDVATLIASTMLYIDGLYQQSIDCLYFSQELK